LHYKEGFGLFIIWKTVVSILIGSLCRIFHLRALGYLLFGGLFGKAWDGKKN